MFLSKKKDRGMIFPGLVNIDPDRHLVYLSLFPSPVCQFCLLECPSWSLDDCIFLEGTFKYQSVQRKQIPSNHTQRPCGPFPHVSLVRIGCLLLSKPIYGKAIDFHDCSHYSVYHYWVTQWCRECSHEEHPRRHEWALCRQPTVSDALPFFQLLEVWEGLNKFINQITVCLKSQQF